MDAERFSRILIALKVVRRQIAEIVRRHPEAARLLGGSGFYAG